MLTNIINFSNAKTLSIYWTKELNSLVDFFENFAVAVPKLAIIFDKLGRDSYARNSHLVRQFINSLIRLIKMIIFGIENLNIMNMTNPKNVSSTPQEPGHKVSHESIDSQKMIQEIQQVQATMVQPKTDQPTAAEPQDPLNPKDKAKPTKPKIYSETISLELRKKLITGATTLCWHNRNFNKYNCSLFDVPMVTRV